MLKNKTILVGVSGSIAAYKICGLVSRLRREGADVWVIMTEAATKLVTPLTFRTLSKNPVIVDLFADELSTLSVPHITLTEKADLFLVAPATANVLGKIAHGIADDPLTTMVMAAVCPKIICPAMNGRMWENAMVQENAQTLKKQGYKFLGPVAGRLACDTTTCATERNTKAGRMVEIDEIFKEIGRIFAADLKGRKILVTAGPTYEDFDPVRYIGNRSSGKMGYAVAAAAAGRGAEVVLVAGPTALAEPAGIKVIKVRSASEMYRAVTQNFQSADTLIMAAAVSDFAPEKVSAQKIKKGPGAGKLIKLAATPDILKSLRKNKGSRKIIGFAAETGDLVKNARQKLKDKGLDLIVANDVSRPGVGFGADDNAVKIISAAGKVFDLPRQPKSELANRILDFVCLQK
ncbi:MAG: bifunctional phosphopantothenoylcysteine decarboxylase/phosphopantothenate--cysteine ligase CoaBC [Candidatus Margulisiibacteriota bacterium]